MAQMYGYIRLLASMDFRIVNTTPLQPLISLERLAQERVWQL